ncbi:MAG: hypothetical protein IPH78_05580 [Bacteroidetes bacterium]|nr:hypothetical protein [Bacteroidota bacterium]
MPYLLLCGYAFPFADDYCFAWTSAAPISFVQKVLNQYLYWNGRYTSDALIQFHPYRTASISTYQSVIFVAVAITPVVNYLLISESLRYLQIEIKTIVNLIFSLSLSLLYYGLMPQLAEGIYWYVGAVNYHFASLAFMALLVLLLAIHQPKSWLAKRGLQCATILLIVVSVGFNEIAAVIVPLALLLLLLAGYSFNRQGNQFLLLCFVVACLSAVAVFFSPGNFFRLSIASHSMSVWQSIYFSLLQSIRFFFRFVFNLPVLLASLFVFMAGGEAKKKVGLPLVYLIFSLSILFVAALLPYLAMGQLGQHRTYNYVLPIFLLSWFLFIVSLRQSYDFSFLGHFQFTCSRKIAFGFLMAVSIFLSGNIVAIGSDLYNGKLTKYRNEFVVREQQLLKSPSIIYPLEHIPAYLLITDAKGDTTFFADKCMSRFYENLQRMK